MPFLQDPPAHWGRAVEAAVERGSIQQFSFALTPSGAFQANVKAAGGSGFNVHLDADLGVAVFRALHPGYGHPWSEMVGDDLGETLDDWWVSALEGPNPDDPDDLEDLEDLEDLL